MILLLVAYLGGVLTILSPCILPVLPFVFARADQPFIRSGLPLLLGMAITFAAVATLAAVGGGWAVQANHYGRLAAILLLAVFGITLLFPELADRMTRPLVRLGSRLSQSASDGARSGSSFGPSFLLGIATGLLWAPCAGPILGLLLTGAALRGANTGTSLLLLAYAAGAATSLAVALLIGGRVFTAMKRSLGAGEWIRRGLGVAVLAGVVVISLGLDTGLLTRVSLASTSGVEQALLDRVKPTPTPAPSMMMLAAKPAAEALPVEGPMPSLSGAVEWLNSPPLTAEGLRGKVVLIDFWTYSCINCLRALPYVEAWSQKYRSQGLVVIGVHAPEFAFERDLGNVHQAVKDLKIDYPVAIDNNYAIWRAFNNQYWPAHYFIDAKGNIRHHHFGEGEYDQSEKVIQQLLIEAGKSGVPASTVAVDGHGAEAAADMSDVLSPETYIGFERAQNFVSPGGAVSDLPHVYTAPTQLQLNQWALNGDWTVGGDNAALDKPNGTISYRFHARDLHLVLGPDAAGKQIRFRVLIDGKPPLGNHGADVDAQGNGTITGQRLYQLVRQAQPIADRDFQIEFLDPGAQAFAFTFG
jgi:cytochrome c biogenesis protein CcdA/thiol-disulfide isomerase/thioredoxin